MCAAQRRRTGSPTATADSSTAVFSALAPAKQGKYLPGSHTPIRAPETLRAEPLDEVLILPWNIAEEVKAQLADLTEQGVRFVTAVPELSVD